MPDPRLSVVIPVYCEENGLAPLLDRLEPALAGCDLSYEVLFVDDGSSDGTWARLEELRVSRPWLAGLRLSRNFGKEAALSAGIEAARGALVLVMDADLQHPPEIVPLLVERWRATGANVVEGVKQRARNEPWISRASARGFYRLFFWLTGFDLGGHTDFKLFDQDVREAWLRLGERTLFFRGLMAWLGFRRERVPFTIPDVPGRHSRWSVWGLTSLAIRAFTSFSALPLQLVTVAGCLFFLFALGLGLQTLYRWWNGAALEGFATVILLQLIIGSATLLGLGLVGAYLARIYEEVKARPRYLISQRL